jgi:hypothetical protein
MSEVIDFSNVQYATSYMMHFADRASEATLDEQYVNRIIANASLYKCVLVERVTECSRRAIYTRHRD